MSTDLLASIDEAGDALLKRARADAEAPEKGKRTITLSDQIKAFEAVAKWAEIRSKIKPVAAEKKEAKVVELRRKFNGGASQRPRVAAAPEEANGAYDAGAGSADATTTQ